MRKDFSLYRKRNLCKLSIWQTFTGCQVQKDVFTWIPQDHPAQRKKTGTNKKEEEWAITIKELQTPCIVPTLHDSTNGHYTRCSNALDFAEYTSGMLYGIQSWVRLNRLLTLHCKPFLVFPWQVESPGVRQSKDIKLLHKNSMKKMVKVTVQQPRDCWFESCPRAYRFIFATASGWNKVSFIYTLEKFTSCYLSFYLTFVTFFGNKLLKVFMKFTQVSQAFVAFPSPGGPRERL